MPVPDPGPPPPKRPGAHRSVALTEKTAESVLAEVVAGVGKNGVTDFCATFARSKETCEMMLDDALRRCLLPGGKLTVRRSLRLPASEGHEEAWKLVVEGRTLDGQKYVSDFPVILARGVPKAEVAIYWTGLGFGNDMDHPSNHTVIPQDACPT
jgi:hypothetical protein